jgi:cytidine deaminase
MHDLAFLVLAKESDHRPPRSENEEPGSCREVMRELVPAFGSVVTISSNKSWVARKGSESLYEAFKLFLVSVSPWFFV